MRKLNKLNKMSQIRSSKQICLPFIRSKLTHISNQFSLQKKLTYILRLLFISTRSPNQFSSSNYSHIVQELLNIRSWAYLVVQLVELFERETFRFYLIILRFKQQWGEYGEHAWCTVVNVMILMNAVKVMIVVQYDNHGERVDHVNHGNHGDHGAVWWSWWTLWSWWSWW